MRVLILVDHVSQLGVYPEDIAPLEPTGWRRDVALLPLFDRARVETFPMALGGSDESGHSFHVNGAVDPLGWRRIARWIRANDIELIHALTSRALLGAAVAGRLAGIPALASIYEIVQPSRFNSLQLIWAKIVQTIIPLGINRLIVPDELTRSGVWQIRYPMSRVEVVYQGAKMQDLKPSDPEQRAAERVALGLPKGPLLTVIAPIEPDQGYPTLIEMVPRLLVRVPDAHIAVVGSGSQLLDMQHKARLLPIHWIVDHPDVRAIIAASDVIAVHPRRDSLPRAVFEAGAAGKPLVGSRVAGISEVILQGTTGLLVTHEDARDFAIQAGRLLLQPTFRNQMGASAYQRAKEYYSLEVQRDRMTRLYEETIYASR